MLHIRFRDSTREALGLGFAHEQAFWIQIYNIGSSEDQTALAGPGKPEGQGKGTGILTMRPSRITTTGGGIHRELGTRQDPLMGQQVMVVVARRRGGPWPAERSGALVVFVKSQKSATGSLGGCLNRELMRPAPAEGPGGSGQSVGGEEHGVDDVDNRLAGLQGGGGGGGGGHMSATSPGMCASGESRDPRIHSPQFIHTCPAHITPHVHNHMLPLQHAPSHSAPGCPPGCQPWPPWRCCSSGWGRDWGLSRKAMFTAEAGACLLSAPHAAPNQRPCRPVHVPCSHRPAHLSAALMVGAPPASDTCQTDREGGEDEAWG